MLPLFPGLKENLVAVKHPHSLPEHWRLAPAVSPDYGELIACFPLGPGNLHLHHMQKSSVVSPKVFHDGALRIPELCLSILKGERAQEAYF